MEMTFKQNLIYALATMLSKFGKSVVKKRSIVYVYEANAPEEMYK
ncbi:cyclic lactone autoinducer peptide [Paenibacillus sp. 453mf]|nr:cyclic lactone autoinducer peptide [Paenibacillus sp. 453mf]SFS60995.1 cyclic lactone autoinducer peptide [Paenibacillus sp. 453mf]